MSEKPCPNCGHCPTCGHTPPKIAQPWPYGWPYGWWQQPYGWWQQPVTATAPTDAYTSHSTASAN